MNTAEIMKLADLFAGQYRIYGPGDDAALVRVSLQTAIDALVEQAAWAHHTPKLLTDADAAADLAGVARPGAGPVAWMYEWQGSTHITTTDQRAVENAHPHFDKSVPLYTTPQASQLPQGWCAVKTEGLRTHVWPMSESQITALALSAPPPQARQPLTDEQLMEILVHLDPETKRLPPGFADFARAIEAAHGIDAQKGKP